MEELLNSAEDEAAGLTGIISPRDPKVKRKIFRWRTCKPGESRQPDSKPGSDRLNASAVAAASQGADTSSEARPQPEPERLLDSTDAASTTRSGGSSTPDARMFHDGVGPDSSRPSSRQSVNMRDDDAPRKQTRHRRGNSWLDFLGLTAKGAADGAVDGGQEACSAARLRSKRGDAPGPTHKPALSCFGMPQVAGDDADSLPEDGPPAIEGLTAGAVGMRNLCNTCFINSTLQCLRATPGLLEQLAPELLADPSRLPSDLVEPLSVGSPTMHLPASPTAAAPEPGDAAPVTPGPAAPPAAADDSVAPGVGTIDAMPASGTPEEPATAATHNAAVARDAAPALPAEDAAATEGPVSGAPEPAHLVDVPAQAAEGAPVAATGAGGMPAGAAPQGDAVPESGTTAPAEPRPAVGRTAPGAEAGGAGTPGGGGSSATSADCVVGGADVPAAAPEGSGEPAAGAPGATDGTQGTEEASSNPPAAAAEAPAPQEASKEEIARDLVQVMVQLAVGTGSDPVAPRQLYRDMANNDMWAQFSNGGQHDSHELLRFVMSVLHEVHDRITEKPPYVELEDVPGEAPRDKAERLWRLLHAREASPLSDLFQGQLESRVTCNKCSSTFYTYEPFMDLSLSLFKEGKTFFRGKTIDKLEDCFRAYTEEEKLEGNEAYFCPACRARHSATKALRIHRFPRCLVLHIKRFKGLNRMHYKLSSNVSFPLHGLNLAPFSSAGKGSGRGGREVAGLYDLYAVSNHTGTLDSGHYTAYVKVADPASEGDQKWLLLADDKVSDAQAESIVSAEAYMLFYVQRAQATTSEDD